MDFAEVSGKTKDAAALGEHPKMGISSPRDDVFDKVRKPRYQVVHNRVFYRPVPKDNALLSSD